MASEEELYISIDADTYRTNKLNILINQADLLNTLKRLQNLKVLARQKMDLKKQILGRFTTIINNIESIQKVIPTPNVPKIIKQRERKLEKSREPKEPEEPEELEEVKERFSRRDEIEEELMTIHEKLRELNS